MCMAAVLRQVEQWRDSGLLGQLIRFGIAGLISAAIYSAVYLPLAMYVFPPHWAVAAVPVAFLVAVVAGFFMHSAWSFKGHGTRDNSGRQHGKFFLVQSFGLGMNAVFTWVLTAALHSPAWVPLVPAIFVTPIATFWLNRRWVFG